MANICDTTYKVIGTSKALNDLYNTIRKLEEKGKGYVRLYELAEHYGIDYEERQICVRGSIYFYEMDELNEVLTIGTETAWAGCHELFHAINDRLDDELSFSWREVEPGCSIYSVHDENDFFPEECMVSANGEPFEDGMEDAFDYISEAIAYWCEAMKFERNNRSHDEMLALIRNYEYSDEDTYFYINEFEFE